MVKRTILGQKYVTYSWEETNAQLLKIAEEMIKKHERFDRIVALAKSGLTWSRTLCDYLAVPELSSIHISFYTGIASTQKSPVIIQSLPISIRNERILIFDDVADSGETLVLAKKYVNMYGAKSVKTATLAVKTWTKFFPDYCAVKSGEWIIFPHEIREAITLLKKSWKKKGMKESTIQRNLRLLGLPKQAVRTFFPLA